MFLAHVQSFISQNLLFASGLPRSPSRLPVNGNSSSGFRQRQLPSSVLRRAHRYTTGNRLPASALRGAPSSAADSRRRVPSGSEEPSGVRRDCIRNHENPTPHWFHALKLLGALQRGTREAKCRDQASLMLTVSTPSGSEEPRGAAGLRGGP
jgi:hypothetical protein